MERKGTAEQVTQVVTETSAWLAMYLQDINVRQAWLNFVEVRGSDELKEATIADVKAWLAEHPSAKEVWRVLLAWLFRSRQSDEAVEVALTAISYHPNNQSLLEHYLRAVQNSADEHTVRSVYEQLIAKYDRHLDPQVHYAAWLREHGCQDEAERRYQGLITKAPRSYKARYGYGMLFLKLEWFNEAASQFREVLKIHKGHQMAHDRLAWALWKLDNFGQAEREFHSAIYWAGIAGQPQGKFYADLGWFYLDRERWPEALQAFESARDEAPDYFGNYWGIGKALMGVGNYAAAADVRRTALEKAPPGLEPPASEEMPEVLRQCFSHLSDNGLRNLLERREVASPRLLTPIKTDYRYVFSFLRRIAVTASSGLCAPVC